MKRVLGLSGAALLAALAAGCSDNATAPAPALSPDMTVVDGEGRRVIEYAAVCEMSYEERGVVPATIEVPQGERVIGKGNCNVKPLGASDVVLEGMAFENNGRYLIEGHLYYLFRDGSRLVSKVRMGEGEVGNETNTVPFDFNQAFLKGTGRLAGTYGGNGAGDGRWHTVNHWAVYKANGRILLAR